MPLCPEPIDRIALQQLALSHCENPNNKLTRKIAKNHGMDRMVQLVGKASLDSRSRNNWLDLAMPVSCYFFDVWVRIRTNASKKTSHLDSRAVWR